MRNLVQPLKTVVKCSTYMNIDSLTEFSNKSSLLGKLLFKKKQVSVNEMFRCGRRLKVLKQVPLVAMSKALTGLYLHQTLMETASCDIVLSQQALLLNLGHGKH